MKKDDLKKVWACLVAGLLAIIAVATVDVALILNEGVSVEYVMEEGE